MSVYEKQGGLGRFSPQQLGVSCLFDVRLLDRVGPGGGRLRTGRAGHGQALG